MNVLFELLFHAWCPSYDPNMLPGHLRDNPIQGYGQYTFTEGVRFGLCLAVSCLCGGEMEELQ